MNRGLRKDDSLLPDLYHPVAQGEHQRLELRMHPELCQDARFVVALGAKAYVEFLGDPLTVKPLGECLQYLCLSGGKACYGLLSCVLLLSLAPGEAEQLHDFFHRHECLTRPQPSYGLYHLIQANGLVQNTGGPALYRPCDLSAVEVRGEDECLRPRVGFCKSPINSPP